jgi:uncharacterized membrane protein
MGEHFVAVPTAVYGIVMLAAAIAYYVLQTVIIRSEGQDSRLARAVGADFKGKISPAMYAAAIAAAFVHPWISAGFYITVALTWLIPDRRIERVLMEEEGR